jgi:hypothetical protein
MVRVVLMELLILIDGDSLIDFVSLFVKVTLRDFVSLIV